MKLRKSAVICLVVLFSCKASMTPVETNKTHVAPKYNDVLPENDAVYINNSNSENKIETTTNAEQTTLHVTEQPTTTVTPSQSETTSLVYKTSSPEEDSKTTKEDNKKPETQSVHANKTSEQFDSQDQTNTTLSPMNDVTTTNVSYFAYNLDSSTQSIEPKTDTEVEDLEKNSELPKDNSAEVASKENAPVNTQIFLFDNTMNATEARKNDVEDVTLNSAGLVPGKLAVVLASVFLVLAVSGYIMLLSWRRYLENRYGNREILVDDDYCEKNDLEHFSI